MKPCPRCGRYEMGASDSSDGWSVCCSACGADGPLAESEDGAIELWDKRAAQRSRYACDFCGAALWRVVRLNIFNCQYEQRTCHACRATYSTYNCEE